LFWKRSGCFTPMLFKAWKVMRVCRQWIRKFVNEICKNIGIKKWGCCCTEEENSNSKLKCCTSCAKAWRHEVGINGDYERKWELGYEIWHTCKDGEFKGIALQKQWEDNHVRLTYLQGEAVVVDEEVLEKFEKNFATLSIMGWWLCTKA